VKFAFWILISLFVLENVGLFESVFLSVWKAHVELVCWSRSQGTGAECCPMLYMRIPVNFALVVTTDGCMDASTGAGVSLCDPIV